LCILASGNKKYNNNSETKELYMNKRRKENKMVPPYVTYALSGGKKRDKRTRADIPYEQSVKEAKDWVDENEK